MVMAWDFIRKEIFTSLSEALKAAWKIIKVKMGTPQTIHFAKKNTGELRTANILAFGSFSTLEKGYLRFVEMLENGTTQWRSLTISRIINL